MVTTRPYSPREDMEIARRWAEGETFATIGRALDRSADAVRARSKRLDLPGRPNVPYRGPNVGRRFGTPFTATPMGFTSYELTQAQRDQKACDWHLIDLLREYASGGSIGEGKAEYRSRCELDIPPGAERAPINIFADHRSFCGSAAAMCEG